MVSWVLPIVDDSWLDRNSQKAATMPKNLGVGIVEECQNRFDEEIDFYRW